jgi:poly(3-hydroxybutyrate) depolymerase
MGYPGVRDLSQVNATTGCGKQADIPAGMWRPFEIMNIPVPAGQSGNSGDGTRKYFVRLPANYDNNKKYKVVIAASSCTGGDQNLRAMGDTPTVTDATGGAILISPVVEPGVWDRDQCYDDKDPNSIEHPFLERFLAQVGEKYCYDKNKVFVQGHSSGGWYSNMVGCVWASDLIRAASSNGGGIPDDSAERPKCNDKPMPGLWIFPTNDPEQPQSAKRAVSRALVVNKCEGAGTNPADDTVWMKVQNVTWSEGGAQGCKKYMCPEAFPVIFCQPQGGHAEIPWHSDAAWAMFNKLP